MDKVLNGLKLANIRPYIRSGIGTYYSGMWTCGHRDRAYGKYECGDYSIRSKQNAWTLDNGNSVVNLGPLAINVFLL